MNILSWQWICFFPFAFFLLPLSSERKRAQAAQQTPSRLIQTPAARDDSSLVCLHKQGKQRRKLRDGLFSLSLSPSATMSRLLLQKLGLWGSRRAAVPSCILLPSIAFQMAPKRKRHDSTGGAGSRGYKEALVRLAQLQSNRSTTQLFEKAAATTESEVASDSPSPHDSSSSSSSASSSSRSRALNATAIPEMRTWLQRAGYSPEKDLCKMRHIHVAGTKGKGSVCAYATALLAKHTRVGTYTSPHLISPRERIAINGEPVSQEIFAEAFFEMWDRFTRAAIKEGWSPAEAEGPASKPFFFRYLTIMAWHIFLTQGVRDVVMECGIGGEYDATNVLPAEAVSAAVVTQLGIDHVAMLGGTVEEIAWHKAGIFKHGKRAFTRRLDDQPRVMEVLRARAEEKGAILVELEDSVVDKWGDEPDVDSLSVKGQALAPAPFRKQNQALAALAVIDSIMDDSGLHALADVALLGLPATIYQTLKDVKIPGRQEVRQEGQVTWCYDGAHTKESLEEAVRWFITLLEPGEKAILVFNQQERDVAELLQCLIDEAGAYTGREVFSHALFTANNTTFLDPQGQQWDLSVQRKAAKRMAEITKHSKIQVLGNIQDTYMEVLHIAGLEKGGKKVLVTGSMHLVGAMKHALGILDDFL